MCEGGTDTAKDALERFERGETLDDGTPPPADPEELDFLRRLIGALETICSDRVAKSVEAFLRLAHERESETCTPFINQYTQTFVQVSDKSWVVESSPAGTCGIVQASRFTLPENGLGTLWEYTAQKVITSKGSVTEMGIPCSGLDETPSLYTWQSGPQRINCVYID